MPLAFREKLTMLMPPSLFYRRRIAEETRSGEPELAVLAEMVPRGGTAIDVGANLGFFAYALSNIADWVVAFEPNPANVQRLKENVEELAATLPGSTAH